MFYPDHYGWPKTPPASSRTCRWHSRCNWFTCTPTAGRYLDEGSPTLAQFADVTATLAAKDPTAP